MIYYANDRYAAVLSSGYTVGQSTLYVSAVPDNVPTVIVAAYDTDNETIFEVTDKTSNSLTGVSRLRGANVDLDAQTPLTCLNNEEFINQFERATGAEVNTGTDEAKIVTPKAIADSIIQTGWTPARETWEYSSTDDPTGVITVPSDVRNKYSPGMRIKFTNGGNVIYGIITDVSESEGTTTIKFLHEINPADSEALYLMADSAITNPYYSTQKAPQGFPLDPSKWSVQNTYSTEEQETSPAQSTYYTVGSMSLEVPIGVWKLSAKAVTSAVRTDKTVALIMGLSTSTSSFSDATLYEQFLGYYRLGVVARPEGIISLSSKDTYYYIQKTTGVEPDKISVLHLKGSGYIKATCAYL